MLLCAALVFGTLIVGGRSVRRAREARRTRLAQPARRLLLAIAAGDDDPATPGWSSTRPRAAAPPRA
ncbi:hypothetical protein ACPPVO_53525 [Dactylosporangium sp. McL0621]|uniref:hypothetical protein n=1 Tax=Dactylosporangium sp. McL0621 TaxID=3415678 RepID=UPI003CF9085E